MEMKDELIDHTDKELVELIKNKKKSEATIRYLYKRYFQYTANFICANNGMQEDAEDIFQEVLVAFIDLIRKEKFRGEATVKTYLYAMTRNLWLNELKKRGRSLLRETVYSNDLEMTNPDFSYAIATREAKEQVYAIMDLLGQTCKKILILFYYDQLPMKEIIEKVNYENEQVLRNKKHKCMKQLSELVNKDENTKLIFKNLLRHGN
ncbi:RNA polymerase sigma factor [Solitalea sp. MAHUQ-68]|uniref:RNA polymerase sigma factor n=1 Tax=Solitalea agri TaxID=2953739 RepID=A0A9X2F8Q4_9SPHI|nr:RNA polymerase sigma factor [Solitalea agri]MCO4292603.1 RNA polymerase sigma factor [Solitalea agri]